MTMKAWYVEGAEQREAYLRFAAYMLNESDAFSLVYFRYSESEALKKSARRVKNLLEPLKIYAQNVNEWPSMITLNENSHIYRLTVYRAEPEAMEALKQADSLWDWDYPVLPMDLCFYKEGYAWFAASSHEEWNSLYTDDEQVIERLRAMGLTVLQEKDMDEAKLFFDERTKKEK